MCALKLENIQLYHWKQGVIIDEPLKETIISGSQFYDYLKDTDSLVLYTQDCDLINPSLEKEPFVEFFCVNKINSISGNYSFGKNPRKIYLRIEEAGAGNIYTLARGLF